MPPVTAPQDRWAALGVLLTERRVEVDPRFRNRAEFAREAQLNDRFVADLEKGRRPTYRDTNLAAAEAAYRLQPGAIARFVQSGDRTLDVVDESTGDTEAHTDASSKEEEFRGWVEGEVGLSEGEALQRSPARDPGWVKYALHRGAGSVAYEFPDDDPLDVVVAELQRMMNVAEAVVSSARPNLATERDNPAAT